MNKKEILTKGLEVAQSQVSELNALIEGGDATQIEALEVAQNKVDSFTAKLNEIEAKETAAQEAADAEADKAIADAEAALEGGDEDADEDADEVEDADEAPETPADQSEVQANSVAVYAKTLSDATRKNKTVKNSIRKEISGDDTVVKNAINTYLTEAKGRIATHLEKNGISIKEGAGKKLINESTIMEIIMADRCTTDDFLGRLLATNIINDFKDSKSWDMVIWDSSQLMLDWTCEAFDCINEADHFDAPCEQTSNKIRIIYQCLYGSCYVNKMAQCLSTMSLVTMSLESLGNNMVDTVLFKLFRDDASATKNINAYDAPDAFAVDRPAKRLADRENHYLKYPTKKVNGLRSSQNPAVTTNAGQGLIASAVKWPEYCNEKGEFVRGGRSVINGQGVLQPVDLDRLVRSVNCGDKSNIVIVTNDCGEALFEGLECVQCNPYSYALNGNQTVEIQYIWRGVPIVNVKHFPNRVWPDGGILCDADNTKCMFLAVNMERLYFGYPCQTKNDVDDGVKGTNTEIGGGFAYGLNDSPLNDKPAVCALIVDAPKDSGNKEAGEETVLDYVTNCNCKPTDVEPVVEEEVKELKTEKEALEASVTNNSLPVKDDNGVLPAKEAQKEATAKAKTKSNAKTK